MRDVYMCIIIQSVARNYIAALGVITPPPPTRLHGKILNNLSKISHVWVTRNANSVRVRENLIKVISNIFSSFP